MDLTRYLTACKFCRKVEDARFMFDARTQGINLSKIVDEVFSIQLGSTHLCKDCKDKVIECYRFRKIVFNSKQTLEGVKTSDSIIENVTEHLKTTNLSTMTLMTFNKTGLAVVPSSIKKKMETMGWKKFETKKDDGAAGKAAQMADPITSRSSTFHIPSNYTDADFKDLSGSSGVLKITENSTLFSSFVTANNETVNIVKNSTFESTTYQQVGQGGRFENTQMSSETNYREQNSSIADLLKRCEVGVNSDMTSYKCFICDDKAFVTQFGMRVHLVRVHQNESERQNFCNDTTAEADNIEKYNLANAARGFKTATDSGFKCASCDLTFENHDAIRDHVIETHLNPSRTKTNSKMDNEVNAWMKRMMTNSKMEDSDRWKCGCCYKMFASKAGLRIHLTTAHMKNWKLFDKVEKSNEESANNHKAMTGRSSLGSDSAINFHLGADSTAKRFSVSENIFSSFKQPAPVKQYPNLSQMNYTTSAVKFLCPHCNLELLNDAEKEDHLSRCGLKKIQCHHCPSSFNSKALLHAHLKRVMGIKDFKCSVCQLGFSARADLKSHISRVHVKKSINIISVEKLNHQPMNETK